MKSSSVQHLCITAFYSQLSRAAKSIYPEDSKFFRTITSLSDYREIEAARTPYRYPLVTEDPVGIFLSALACLLQFAHGDKFAIAVLPTVEQNGVETRGSIELVVVGSRTGEGICHSVEALLKVPTFIEDRGSAIRAITRIALAHGGCPLFVSPFSLNSIDKLLHLRESIAIEGTTMNSRIVKFIDALLAGERLVPTDSPERLIETLLTLYGATPKFVLEHWQANLEGFFNAEEGMRYIYYLC